jgi:hypothetical protein
MMHTGRPFAIRDVSSAEELAELLTQHTWTTCTGFRLGSWLFLNDSTSADGAQEYAIVRDGCQYESVTFGWMTQARALDYIDRFIANPIAVPLCTVELKPHPNGSCSRCA